MVLNRDGTDEDAKLSNEQWKLKEANFFENLKSQFSMYLPYSNNLGVDNLVRDLSAKLSAKLLESADYLNPLRKQVKQEE